MLGSASGRLTALACLVCLLSIAPSVSAQDTDQNLAGRQFVEETYIESLRGWKFLAIECHAEKEVQWQKDTCEFIQSDIELILAQNSLAGAYCPNCSPVDAYSRLQAHKDDYLSLSITFYSTNSGDGGAVFVTADRFYSGVVDSRAPKGSALSLPRTGSLELWSEYAAFSGSSITPPEVAPYIIVLVKKFLVPYIKAQQLPQDQGNP